MEDGRLKIEEEVKNPFFLHLLSSIFHPRLRNSATPWFDFLR